MVKPRSRFRASGPSSHSSRSICRACLMLLVISMLACLREWRKADFSALVCRSRINWARRVAWRWAWALRLASFCIVDGRRPARVGLVAKITRIGQRRGLVPAGLDEPFQVGTRQALEILLEAVVRGSAHEKLPGRYEVRTAEYPATFKPGYLGTEDAWWSRVGGFGRLELVDDVWGLINGPGNVGARWVQLPRQGQVGGFLGTRHDWASRGAGVAEVVAATLQASIVLGLLRTTFTCLQARGRSGWRSLSFGRTRRRRPPNGTSFLARPFSSMTSRTRTG